MRDSNFVAMVKEYYKEHKRTMPWRQTTDPYHILISEVMLQQTQVDRVIPKFRSFIQAFPTIQDLAQSDFKTVLGFWNGLGYNRRALWLHVAAKEIVKKHFGNVPHHVSELVQLKGIGHNTAAAICAYAFNQPVVFIETNIRAVFIHHFFPHSSVVSDSELLPIVAEHVDKDNPREWYWALMDYGVSLKKAHKNPARKSKHHTTQSTFEGSNRQLRGKLLKFLLKHSPTSVFTLADSIAAEKDKIQLQLKNLEKEGLILVDQESSTVRLS